MIYADHNASAPLSKDVREYLKNRLEGELFANPNSLHHLGKKIHLGMENARKICAKSLGAAPDQIIFNSGASEGISTVFHSIFKNQDSSSKKNIFIISGIEHPAVYRCAEEYEKKGFIKKTLPTLSDGTIDLNTLDAWISEFGENIFFISIIASNNETGVIQPYSQIAHLCTDNNIPFFADTTQSIGKEDFNFGDSGIDYAVMSGHKIGALSGTGILVAKNPTTLSPLIFGGGQERDLRNGTQNYLGIETLAVALINFQQNKDALKDLKKAKHSFEGKLKKSFPEIVILGGDSPRLSGTTCLSLPGIHGQAVQIELESKDIYVTTSSACSDNEPMTSNVLKSMGIDEKTGRGVIRIGLGYESNPEDYEKIATALNDIFKKLARVHPF